MKAKGKLGFITGNIIKPTLGTREYNLWMKNDVMIVAWIKNSMSSNIKTSFTYVKSAQALWKSLKVKFGQTNGLLIFQLKRSLFNLKQGDDDLTSYFSKVQMSLDELRDVQPLPDSMDMVRDELEAFLDQDNLVMFLNGLNS